MTAFISTVVWFTVRDVLRSRWAIILALFFIALTEGLFQLGGGGTKVIVGLMSVTVVLAPLVSVVFGTMYFYNSRDFIELLLTQPVDRRSVYSGLYLGLAGALGLGIAVGIALPALWRGSLHGADVATYGLLILVAVLLTFVFAGMAFVMATVLNDRGKGMGFAILLWFFFSVLYDALVLAVVHYFGDYPLERPMLAMVMLNPIDLGRILMLMQTDVSALMGYTGAIFRKFFTGPLAMVVSLSSLTMWIAGAYLIGIRQFARKDF